MNRIEICCGHPEREFLGEIDIKPVTKMARQTMSMKKIATDRRICL
jgi:hypothetical protein